MLIPRDAEKKSYLIGPHSDRGILIDYPMWVEERMWFGNYCIKGDPEYTKNKVGSPMGGLMEAIKTLDLTKGRIGIEAAQLSMSAFNLIEKNLSKVELIDATSLLKSLG